MSLSGKGCEKCNGKGCVPFSDDAPRSVMRPCGACSEPWGPQWLDAPDGDGFWWMLVKGGTPEPVRVQQMRLASGEVYTHVTTTRGTFGPDDVIGGDGVRWLRLAAPEVPQ